MPTGYTSKVAEGISFEEFVMICVRGMGVCVSMRDESMDKHIPKEFEPSDYHKKEIIRLKRELVALQKADYLKVEKLAEKEYNKEVKYRLKRIDEKEALKKKYIDMITAVNFWAPPTKEHDGFKKFMLDQLQQSLEFDCNITYYLESRPVKLSGGAWLNTQVVRKRKDIVYHEVQDKEEVERVADRNLWIKQLRESLKQRVK